MKTFELSCGVTVSGYTKVEANTLEEAIEIAEGRDCVIGGINSGNSDRESWVIDDADGLPSDIHEL